MALNCIILTKYLRNVILKRNTLLALPNYQSSRGIREWQKKTLRLMYHRSRMRDAIKIPELHRSQFQEWNYRSELFAFGQRLHEKFSEENLRIAFTHKSYVENEEKKRKEMGMAEVAMDFTDNSRLADDGEKIMTSYIKAYLRHFFPRVPEDGIRAIHDYLMSDTVLADISKWIGCNDLILSKDFSPLSSTSATTVKALIGAIAVDNGTEHAERFVLDFVLTYLADKDVYEIWNLTNGESILQRIIEREHLPPAEPRLLHQSAKRTVEACYVIGLYINKQLISSSPGETVAIAKEMAALDALKRIFNLTPSATLLKFGEKGYHLDLSESRREHLYLSEWAPSLVKRDKIPLLNIIKNN